MSILNGLRQFETLDLMSTPLSIDSIRMNKEGLIKIENSLSNPQLYEEFVEGKRSRIIPTNFQIKQTYNLGLLLLEICTFSLIDFQDWMHEATLI